MWLQGAYPVESIRFAWGISLQNGPKISGSSLGSQLFRLLLRGGLCAVFHRHHQL